MARESRRNDLGEFLKTRRAELPPATAGLPHSLGRRVPGLRREEVAVLAAISTDYYRRLEQGRIEASPSVLASLARVLRLDDDQRTYLYELAGTYCPPRPPSARLRVQCQLQRVLDDMAHTPAWAFGPRTEVLAWNAMGAALVTDFAKIPEDQRYYIRMLFADPALRSLYADWEEVTRLGIAQMRRHNSQNPDDPQLKALVTELSACYPQFRRWWADHDVATRDAGRKHLRHPVVGDLLLDWNVMSWAADPDQGIIMWTAEPGSPSEDALRLLASWAAVPHRIDAKTPATQDRP
ncbi:helix-turn-helix transcriptional regulator [Nocardia sp. CA2R105]|uniref:helix-turn-helix domain-containing protein n=1 Tax=Nocardia coffeae TaxID=2873381 RepID=UPI001CA64A76|nr:helix-turn-helix transcriptional regulator [Nocardia coffeae]MBY8862920.1 helix-turn-helix transcriptional regulator [Nocardia coffeae]